MPEAVRAEINLVSLVIDPKNVMPVLFKLHFEKVLRLLKPFEDPTLRDNGSEIHNALIPIGKDELQYTVNNGLGCEDSWQLFHLICPGGKRD